MQPIAGAPHDAQHRSRHAMNLLREWTNRTLQLVLGSALPDKGHHPGQPMGFAAGLLGMLVGADSTFAAGLGVLTPPAPEQHDCIAHSGSGALPQARTSEQQYAFERTGQHAQRHERYLPRPRWTPCSPQRQAGWRLPPLLAAR